MNKKITAMAVTALLCAGSAHAFIDMNDLSISTSFAVEGAYVFRGKQVTSWSFQPSIEFGADGYYAGIWTNQPFNNNDQSVGGPASGPDGNEVDFYLGYGMEIADPFSIDVGFTYFWYPDATAGLGGVPVDRSREIYIGATADVMLSPAVYFYYDFDLEQVTLELSVAHSVDLSDMVDNTSLELGGYWGFLNADDLNGGQIATPAIGGDPENGYSYWGLTADVVYSFNDTSSASIGIRYSGNNDNGNAVGATDGFGDRALEDSFWFGASYTAGF